MTFVFSGSGPGRRTPDGCSVELYRRLPYLDELADIEPELGSRTAALELGCGTGRLCGRLQALGLRATGVDESADMLALLPPGVEGIEGRIETLDLGRRWPVVLLPSRLINHPDASVRRRFVAAARRHVEPAGVFYVNRHSTRWLASVRDGPLGESHGVRYAAEQVRRDGDRLTMTLRYDAFGQTWSQSFTTCALTKPQVEDILAGCGFGHFRWLGSQALWVAATPIDP